MTGLRIDSDRMWRNIESNRGVVFSQRVLLALVEKGMSRTDAYGLVHRHSMNSWQDGGEFRELIQSDAEVESRLSGEELEELFDYKYYVRYVDEIFERVGLV